METNLIEELRMACKELGGELEKFPLENYAFCKIDDLTITFNKSPVTGETYLDIKYPDVRFYGGTIKEFTWNKEFKKISIITKKYIVTNIDLIRKMIEIYE